MDGFRTMGKGILDRVEINIWFSDWSSIKMENKLFFTNTKARKIAIEMLFCGKISFRIWNENFSNESVWNKFDTIKLSLIEEENISFGECCHISYEQIFLLNNE